MFFQRFESSVALLGEGDGKRSQGSSRELGVGAVGAPAGHSAAALLPAPEEEISPCFINARGATWEASGRKWSPGLNALLRMVARERKRQPGEHLFCTSEGKEAAKTEERGLPLRAMPGPWGAAPARLGGWQQQSGGPAVPPLPFLPSRAKELKTRLGILLHKPELGHRIGTSGKLQLGSRRR